MPFTSSDEETHFLHAVYIQEVFGKDQYNRHIILIQVLVTDFVFTHNVDLQLHLVLQVERSMDNLHVQLLSQMEASSFVLLCLQKRKCVFLQIEKKKPSSHSLAMLINTLNPRTFGSHGD